MILKLSPGQLDALVKTLTNHGGFQVRVDVESSMRPSGRTMLVTVQLAHETEGDVFLITGGVQPYADTTDPAAVGGSVLPEKNVFSSTAEFLAHRERKVKP